MSPQIRADWPGGGVSENWAFSDQEQGTCRDGQNVRNMRPRNRRIQGATRSGQSRYTATRLSTGSTKRGQDVGYVTLPQKTVDFTRPAEGDIVTEWEADTPISSTTRLTTYHVKIDPQGNVVTCQKHAIVIYSADGKQIERIPLDSGDNDHVWRTLELSPFGDIYVAVTSSGLGNTGNVSGAAIKCFEKQLKPDGIDWEYVERWTIPVDEYIVDMVVWENRLYTVSSQINQEQTAVIVAAGAGVDTVRIYSGLFTAAPTELQSYSVSTGTAAHATGIDTNKSGDVFVSFSTLNAGSGSVGELRKFSNSDGTVVWTVGPIGRIGAGCLVVKLDDQETQDEIIWTMGRFGAVDSAITGWRDQDTGPSTIYFSIDMIGVTMDDIMPRMDFDAYGGVYLPFYSIDNTPAPGVIFSARGIEPFPHLTSYFRYLTDPGTPEDSLRTFAVAATKEKTDHEGDISIEGSEFLVLAMHDDSFETAGTSLVTNQKTVRKIRLIDSAQNADNPRSTIAFGVAEGTVKTFTTAAVATPTGQSPALLDTHSATLEPYISHTVYKNRVYFTDGRRYAIFDPKADSVVKWEVERGSLPMRARLITTWGDRIVLAHADSEDGPQNWFMGAIGKSDVNWDEGPPRPTPAQAISGNNALFAGTNRDIINQIIPYNDDILVFGGDHSIHYLVGDPMDGGRIQLHSRITGMAFGQKAHTYDRAGNIYFAGQQGGIFRMVPGQSLERLTENKIEKRLLDVDQTLFYFELEWNYWDEGLHVFVIPYAETNSTILEHYFWEARTNAWWPDKLNHQDIQPGASAAVDSDTPNDRTLVIVGMDGFVRRWDRDATKDDQNSAGDDVLIDSFVDMGPYMDKGRGISRYSQLKVALARDMGGCHAQWFGVDNIGDPLDETVSEHPLRPGQNRALSTRIRAPYTYLRLRSASLFGWALEEATMQAFPAGRKRSRIS